VSRRRCQFNGPQQTEIKLVEVTTKSKENNKGRFEKKDNILRHGA